MVAQTATALAEDSTKQRLLDAAETLFAENGFPATSLRAITQLAQANLAAVHYHFGSKENLFAAVIVRRLEPLNAERLALLDRAEAEARAANRPLPLSAILSAIIRPALRMLRDPDQGGRYFAILLSRCHSEPNSEVHSLVHEMVEPTFLRFLQAVRTTLPHLSEATFRWRTHLLMGSLFFLVAQGDYLRKHTEGICSLDNVDEAEAQFVAFANAGLLAPEPS